MALSNTSWKFHMIIASTSANNMAAIKAVMEPSALPQTRLARESHVLGVVVAVCTSTPAVADDEWSVCSSSSRRSTRTAGFALLLMPAGDKPAFTGWLLSSAAIWGPPRPTSPVAIARAVCGKGLGSFAPGPSFMGTASAASLRECKFRLTLPCPGMSRLRAGRSRRAAWGSGGKAMTWATGSFCAICTGAVASGIE